MRRALLTIALTGAVAAPAALGAPGDAVGPPPPASVKLVDCSLERHEAAFYARMHLIEGTDRMALRYTLLERTGEDGFRRLRAPGLRRWRWSKPGVLAFGYRQRLRNLPEHATHRVRVEFRWYSADGEELARVRRRSAPCRQFVELPNLTAQLTRIAATSLPGVVRYRTVVSNTGRAAVKLVPLRLTVDGGVVDTVNVGALRPGESRTLAIRGPECAGSARVEVDPDGSIAESSEGDNAHEVPCD